MAPRLRCDALYGKIYAGSSIMLMLLISRRLYLHPVFISADSTVLRHISLHSNDAKLYNLTLKIGSILQIVTVQECYNKLSRIRYSCKHIPVGYCCIGDKHRKNTCDQQQITSHAGRDNRRRRSVSRRTAPSFQFIVGVL